uniref:GLOBIN domain-containing protein n=1 Tax=Ascaris lumbricoides TaxID=6252 RepID=A0A0M3HT66_ASCLU
MAEQHAASLSKTDQQMHMADKRSASLGITGLLRMEDPIDVRISFSQRQALIASWKAMRPQACNVMRKILISLENDTPKVKQIFYKAAVLDAFSRESTPENTSITTSGTIEEHVKFMTNFFDELIQNIDNECEAISQIRKIGQDHAKLNHSCSFNAEIWERLGEIAMQTLSSLDAVQKTREGAKAWLALIACVTDELRCGFEGETRVFSRKSSSAERLTEDEELQQRMRQMRLEFTSTVPF